MPVESGRLYSGVGPRCKHPEMTTTKEPDAETVTAFGLNEVIAALARDLKKAQAMSMPPNVPSAER